MNNTWILIKNPKASIIRFFIIPHTKGWYASVAKPSGNKCERAVFLKKYFSPTDYKEQLLFAYRIGPYPLYAQFPLRDSLFSI